MLNLTGKTALVTGSGSGIGQGIAVQVARQGAQVIVNDVVTETDEESARRIIAEGFNASTSYNDLLLINS